MLLKWSLRVREENKSISSFDWSSISENMVIFRKWPLQPITSKRYNNGQNWFQTKYVSKTLANLLKYTFPYLHHKTNRILLNRRGAVRFYQNCQKRSISSRKHVYETNSETTLGAESSFQRKFAKSRQCFKNGLFGLEKRIKVLVHRLEL